MKHVKSVILVAFIAITFFDCKKDRDEPKEGFDPTKYYVIATEKYSPVAQLGGVITFDPGGLCSAYNMEDLDPDVFEYEYHNGHIRITDAMDGTVFADLTIANGQIQHVTSTDGEFINYDVKLYKIPDANAFVGKTFDGDYYTTSINNPAGKSAFTFSDTKWSNGRITGDYILHNNAFATADSNSPNALHFVAADGKLLFFNLTYNTYGALRLR